jgi:capsid portal protein
MDDKVKDLEEKLLRYEQNGIAKLFYSLNRKAWEMADLMNSINLKTLDIADPKDKTFDRLKVIWTDSASIAIAVKTLGEAAGVSGNEEKDMSKKTVIRTSPESIADALGNTAGQYR